VCATRDMLIAVGESIISANAILLQIIAMELYALLFLLPALPEAVQERNVEAGAMELVRGL